VKYIDDPVLLVREETALQGIMSDRLKLEHAMEWKGMWKKTKAMGISREPSPVQIILDQKQLQNVDYLNYFGR
jgi:hypothetical protein